MSRRPVPTLPAGLDYLSSPSGVIAEAQQLAAQAFGADRTWFLVNGCSAGIHAAVMAVAGPGAGRARRRRQQVQHPQDMDNTSGSADGQTTTSDAGGQGAEPASEKPGVLLVARNCHLSVFSALVLSGLEPVWLAPELDPRAGVAHCVTPGTVAAALAGAAAAGRRVAGVMVVSPTYFGAVADVRGACVRRAQGEGMNACVCIFVCMCEGRH